MPRLATGKRLTSRPVRLDEDVWSCLQEMKGAGRTINEGLRERLLNGASGQLDRYHGLAAAYEAAIRKHRDQRGDDRCWMDDEDLYRVLPEGYTAPNRDSAIEIQNCERFIQSRMNPGTEYVSPEREIERLRAENAELRVEVENLAETVLAWQEGPSTGTTVERLREVGG